MSKWAGGDSSLWGNRRAGPCSAQGGDGPSKHQGTKPEVTPNPARHRARSLPHAKRIQRATMEKYDDNAGRTELG